MGGTVRSPLSPYSSRSDRGILRLCWYVYSTATFIYMVIDSRYVFSVFVRCVERYTLKA